MELMPELPSVDRARLFWTTQDPDCVFSEIHNQLNQIHSRIRTQTATDRDLVQSLKLLEALDWPFVTLSPVMQVVIGSEVEPCLLSPTLALGTVPGSEGPLTSLPESPPTLFPEVPQALRPEVPPAPPPEVPLAQFLDVPLDPSPEVPLAEFLDDPLAELLDVPLAPPTEVPLAALLEVPLAPPPQLLEAPFPQVPQVPQVPQTPHHQVPQTPHHQVPQTPHHQVPQTPPHQVPQALPTEYQPHICGKSCVPTLPMMPEARLYALNPLNVPLVYGFHRSNSGVDQLEESVFYTAPCGLRLCNHDDVMNFLLNSESIYLLQSELFSFSPCVSVVPCAPSSGPAPVCGPDLSRGQELTPVELCLREGERSPMFKYRRDRWPHGCFLSSNVYSSFCNCGGRCGSGPGEDPGVEGACSCVSMKTGHSYKHGRLLQPNNNGIVECGPWCGCDPGLCQNRVVQRGLRVRLQVFRTRNSPLPSPNPSLDQNPESYLDQILERSLDQSQDQDRGWGVRCKDDLEQGTFICVYAGLVLQRANGQSEAPPLKQRREELAADDEIQLVTEWLPSAAPNADPAHVPVIQRGSDITDQVTVNGSKRSLDQTQTRARALQSEDLYLIDSSKEGNASRFFNHSCEPTLFIQSVFTDSHDKRFPHIAFFTKRDLKAGTELTWDYNSAPPQKIKVDEQEVDKGVQEVPCLCRSVSCRQRFHVMDLRNPIS